MYFTFTTFGVAIYFIVNINCSDEQVLFENYYIQSTYIPNFHSRTKRNTEDCNILNLNISNTEYKLCILMWDISESSVLDYETQIFMQDQNFSQFDTINDLNIQLSSGYVGNIRGQSYVRGYVSKDRFYGKVGIKLRIYYVEPVEHFPGIVKKHGLKDLDQALIFENLNNNTTFPFDRKIKRESLKRESKGYPLPYGFGGYEKINGKLCSLMIAIDNSFLQRVAKGSIETAIKIITLNLDEANAIFRSTDFDNDGMPDNVGFVVRKIIFLASRDPNLSSVLSTPITKRVDPKWLLQVFTTFKLLKYSCLGILISAQPFIDNYLGVSFTPEKTTSDRHTAGICAQSNRFGPPLNSLLVTYALNNGDMLPNGIVPINLAHELAHSFGSDHDDGDCLQGHIMSPKTTPLKNISNFIFSDCTKRDISFVLRTQGHCLEDIKKPFCGNGLVEENEECDCGSTYTCIESDDCCSSRLSKNACTVNRRKGHQCHPSQGLCCTSVCQYKDLSHIGLNCNGIVKKCPCLGDTNTCSCGLYGQCTGDECHSVECARIGLKECKCEHKHKQKCHVCCLDSEGRCVSSRFATKKVLSTNESIAEYLSRANDKLRIRADEIGEKLCVATRCVQLAFKMVKPDDYCTYKGELGFCLGSACYVPSYVSNKFPLLRIANGADYIMFMDCCLMLIVFMKLFF